MTDKNGAIIEAREAMLGLSLYISVAGGISLLLFIVSLFFEYTRDNISPYLVLCWFVSMPVALEIHKLGGGK